MRFRQRFTVVVHSCEHPRHPGHPPRSRIVLYVAYIVFFSTRDVSAIGDRICRRRKRPRPKDPTRLRPLIHDADNRFSGDFRETPGREIDWLARSDIRPCVPLARSPPALRPTFYRMPGRRLCRSPSLRPDRQDRRQLRRRLQVWRSDQAGSCGARNPGTQGQPAWARSGVSPRAGPGGEPVPARLGPRLHARRRGPPNTVSGQSLIAWTVICRIFRATARIASRPQHRSLPRAAVLSPVSSADARTGRTLRGCHFDLVQCVTVHTGPRVLSSPGQTPPRRADASCRAGGPR